MYISTGYIVWRGCQFPPRHVANQGFKLSRAEGCGYVLICEWIILYTVISQAHALQGDRETEKKIREPGATASAHVPTPQTLTLELLCPHLCPGPQHQQGSPWPWLPLAEEKGGRRTLGALATTADTHSLGHWGPLQATEDQVAVFKGWRYPKSTLLNPSATGATTRPSPPPELEQMDWTGMYRIFHPTAEECTFFSNTHGTFFRIDHMADLKTNLDKVKKI